MGRLHGLNSDEYANTGAGRGAELADLCEICGLRCPAAAGLGFRLRFFGSKAADHLARHGVQGRMGTEAIADWAVPKRACGVTRCDAYSAVAPAGMAEQPLASTASRGSCHHSLSLEHHHPSGIHGYAYRLVDGCACFGQGALNGTFQRLLFKLHLPIR
jgi:hypothetical protein